MSSFFRWGKQETQASIESSTWVRALDVGGGGGGDDAVALVRDLARTSAVPRRLEARVLAALVGVFDGDDRDRAGAELLGDDETALAALPNRRVVVADVARTRQDEDLFRSDAVRGALERTVARFCADRGAPYRQGLNEVVAPWFGAALREAEASLGTPGAMPSRRAAGRCLAAFATFVDAYAPFLVTEDAEAEALQLACEIFSWLLRYHDPSLARALDQHDVSPQLFATPWLLTVGARCLPLDAVVDLWTRYLVDGDASLNVFAGLGVVLAARAAVLEGDAAGVPGRLCAALGDATLDAGAVAARAAELRAATPRSLRRLLSDACFGRARGANRGDAAALRRARRAVASWSCVGLAADDVARALAERAAGPRRGLKYVVLDCRRRTVYEKKRVATALHVCPSALEDPEALDSIVADLAPLRGACHFALVGEVAPSAKVGPLPGTLLGLARREGRLGVDALELGRRRSGGADGDDAPDAGDAEDADVARFALLLQQRGFPRVGHVRGGFAALADALGRSGAAAGAVLVDDAPPTPPTRPRSGSGMSDYLRSRLSSFSRSSSAEKKLDELEL